MISQNSVFEPSGSKFHGVRRLLRSQQLVLTRSRLKHGGERTGRGSTIPVGTAAMVCTYFCVALDPGLYWCVGWGAAPAALKFSVCPR